MDVFTACFGKQSPTRTCTGVKALVYVQKDEKSSKVDYTE
jgi:hypothetical protein